MDKNEGVLKIPF